MPFAITHILAAILLIELYREYFSSSKKLPRYYILIAAIGSMIPDLDIAAYYVLYSFGFSFEQIHKTFFHTIFIPLILLLISLFFYKTGIKNKELSKKHLKISSIFFIFAGASLLHLMLDSLFTEVMLFYPFSLHEFGINIIKFVPEGLNFFVCPTLDGILLFLWIFWMEFKLKISRYF